MGDLKYYTEEGLQALKDELEQLERFERPKISKQIGEAIDKGDLSENAEYDAAKDAQGLLELKINEMEITMGNARILDESQLDGSQVTVFSNVTIKNLKTEKSFTYKLVSETEANFKEKKISVSSPIGKGLLGKKVGETATVTTPTGSMEFEVVEITIG